MSDGLHHLFRTFIDSSNERDFSNDFFSQLDQPFTKKIGGEPSHSKNDQQCYDQPESGNTLPFRNGCSQVNENFGENGRQCIEIFEKKLQDKISQSDGQSDQ